MYQGAETFRRKMLYSKVPHLLSVGQFLCGGAHEGFPVLQGWALLMARNLSECCYIFINRLHDHLTSSRIMNDNVLGGGWSHAAIQVIE